VELTRRWNIFWAVFEEIKIIFEICFLSASVEAKLVFLRVAYLKFRLLTPCKISLLRSAHIEWTYEIIYGVVHRSFLVV
jgi:hypothetical protein